MIEQQTELLINNYQLIINEMPTYEAYKDSGVEWLGEIPAHWKSEKLKFNAELRVSNVDKHSKKLELPVKLANYVDVYKNNFITNSIMFMEVTANEEEIERFSIQLDDVLITKDSEDWLDIGVPALVKYQEKNLLCGYHLAIIRSKANAKGEFLFWALLAKYNRIQFSLKANGVTRFGISHGAIKNNWLAFPPLPEQTAIAAFLDRKTAQIDQAVAIKEQQIALLKEHKQILIQNTVTRGLDPNVPMRDSGVEWIGEIPAHWNCSRLKIHSKIQSGITLGKSYRNQSFVEMPYIRVANVQNGYFKLDDVATISLPNNEIARYLLQDGDILVTEGGDIDKLGRGTVWRNNIKPCLHQNHVFAIRVNKSILSQDFVSSFLATDMARKYFIDTATKTTNLASTNRTHLGNLYLPIPSLTEQTAIVAHIETQSAKIDQAITIQQQQIGKLKEYKATLINSAVTGKILVN